MKGDVVSMNKTGSIWTLVSPKPPPKHGASRAVEVLLDGPTPGIEWRHVNATYTASIAELQKLSLRKVFRLAEYLWQMIREGQKSDGILLTPSFQANTFLKDSLFIWCASLFVRKPLVAWYHMRYETMSYQEQGKIMKWYVEATLKLINKHVCVAPSLVKGMPDFLDENSLHAVSNGIPRLGDSEERKESIQYQENRKIRILYVSNFTENKGWRLLLEIARELCLSNESLEFVFYGAPTRECQQSALERAFSEIGNVKQIRYMGILEDNDKPEVFKAADILAFPSFNEAFPITLLEAMSVGLPIVATEVGGISDAVKDGKGGFVVPARNLEAFREGLIQLVEQADLRRQFGEFNKKSFEKSFTNEKFCRSWAEFLNELRTKKV